MAKKKPQGAKPSKTPPKASPPGESAPPKKRVSKNLETLRQQSREEQMKTLQAATDEWLLDLFESSYPAELVNLLLDLKKAVVKALFERMADLKRKVVAEPATLFHYKEYLTNPLPLRIDLSAGVSLPNYYAILGVPRDAVDEDLKLAHKLLSRAHDPGSFSPELRPAGEDRLKEINEAYHHLRAPDRRAKADKLLPNVSYLYPRRDQSWLESVQRLLE